MTDADKEFSLDDSLVFHDQMTSRVRNSIQEVTNEGPLEHVSIDDGALGNLSDRLADEGFTLHDWRSPVMIDEADYGVGTVLDYFFVGKTLNFVFDDVATRETFRTTYDGETWSGAFAMWASLNRASTPRGSILATVGQKTNVDVRVFPSYIGLSAPHDTRSTAR